MESKEANYNQEVECKMGLGNFRLCKTHFTCHEVMKYIIELEQCIFHLCGIIKCADQRLQDKESPSIVIQVNGIFSVEKAEALLKKRQLK